MSAVHALVVDDDPSWQQILREILEDMGLVVDVTDTLPGAIQRLKQVAYRVAVVDLALSPTDHRNQQGLNVLEAIEQHNPGCTPLLLTGYATVELAVSALTDYGAFTCLRKSAFSRAQFRSLINEALATAPATDGPPATVPASAQAAAITDAGSEATALVVEDDAGWRDILAELLAEAGYRVRACSSFGEALGYIGREKFTLAVVDLALAEPAGRAARTSDTAHGGYRVLAFTRAHHIPTLVVSGIATPGEIEQVYADYGIYTCLAKQTFDRREFLRVVHEAARAPQEGDIDETFAALTDREQDVLALLAQGMTNKAISQALFISPNTVKRHLKSIFAKLDVNTRAAAVAKAISGNFPLPGPPTLGA